jgi:hypothetical protein
MKTITMQTVDREHFIAYLDGMLLHFRNGKGFIVEERACILAEEALERGERVALRCGSVLTGTFLEIDADTGEIHENDAPMTKPKPRNI